MRKGGYQATYFCPVCNHIKRKLEISLNEDSSFGNYHCWVCHFSGKHLGSLFTKLNATQSQLDQLFDLTKDVRINKSKVISPDKPKLSLPLDFIPMSSPYTNILYKHALLYLKKRGIGMADIIRYNIGYCESGEYRDCVIIPSYDENGELNYFSSRSFYSSSKIKYRNAPFSKNIVGFECFINYDEPISLTEGAFDAIAIRNNAIPLFGTIVSKNLKEKLLLHKTKRVNLILDNDAMRESIRAMQELWRWGINVHLIKLNDKDPSELGFKKIHDLINNSNSTDFEDFIYYKLME